MNVLQCCFCFLFWLVGLEACEILVFRPRTPQLLHRKAKSQSPPPRDVLITHITFESYKSFRIDVITLPILRLKKMTLEEMKQLPKIPRQAGDTVETLTQKVWAMLFLSNTLFWGDHCALFINKCLLSWMDQGKRMGHTPCWPETCSVQGGMSQVQ